MGNDGQNKENIQGGLTVTLLYSYTFISLILKRLITLARIFYTLTIMKKSIVQGKISHTRRILNSKRDIHPDQFR